MKPTVTIKNTLVIDHVTHRSYKLDNLIDAKKLCQTLLEYHKVKKQQETLDKQYDKLYKQLIQLKLTSQILNGEINQLDKMITWK